jgi:hypothetical protein
MKQFARSPLAMRRVARLFRERDRLLASAPSMSDSEVAALVSALLRADPGARQTLAMALEQLGNRAKQPLLLALDDPRCDPSEESKRWDERSIFEIIVDLLGRMGTTSVVDRFGRFLTSGTTSQRKAVARAVASVGNDEAVSYTLTALRDPEEYVRFNAIQGIFTSVKAGRASSAFSTAMFDILAGFVTGDAGFDAFSDREAVGCLVCINRERAIDVLRSDAGASLDNGKLQTVLAKLHELGETLDRDRVLRLLQHAKGNSKHPWKYVQIECIRMLTKLDSALAIAEAEAATASEEETIRRGGARVLCEINGLGDANQLPFNLDTGTLPKPVAHVLAAWQFQAEVRNGGVSQYFFNPSGKRWPLALEAFNALGAKSCSEIMRSAVAFLGPEGSSADQGSRIRTYAAISDNQEKTLDELSGRFYEDEDRLDVLITRYMLRHADTFKDAIRQYVSKAT